MKSIKIYFKATVVWIYLQIRKKIFNYYLKKAVLEAKEKAELFDRRYLVIAFKGRPRCYEKRRLKDLIAMRKFKKGTTIQQLEKMAYYISK